MDNIPDIQSRLADLNARLAPWHDRADAAFNEIFKFNEIGPGQFESKAKEAAEASQRELAGSPREELFGLLDELCGIYAEADDEQRAYIRRMVNANREVYLEVSRHRSRTIRQFEATGDPALLRRALISISVEDMGRDYRDTLMTLAYIWLAARRAGVDPAPYFKEVTRLSSTESLYGIAGMGTTQGALVGFTEARAEELHRAWRETK